MAQYKKLNVRLSNSQLNKLKSAIKNGSEVTSYLSSNIIGDSDDQNNFSHKFLLTNTHDSRLRKAFGNNSSANIKWSKTQLHRILQSGGFLGRRLVPFLKTGLPLIGNILIPLAKSVLIPLGLTEAASATNAAIHKKMFASRFIVLIIPNE